MIWRLFFFSSSKTRPLSQTLTPIAASSPFSTSLLNKKLPKRFRRKRKKKESARTKKVQTKPNQIPSLERILDRDNALRFLIRSKNYIAAEPERVLRLDTAGSLHRELGFPRGRKISRFLEHHPLVYQTYRHSDGKLWIGFTDAMEDLLEEESRLADALELDRVNRVRKLLMMSAGHRIALSKLHHCRSLFGIPVDFRDRVLKYPEFFRVAVDDDRRHVLELATWDASLAVSALEREFMTDEAKVRKAFRFGVKHEEHLGLDEGATTLPLVSPYSDGSKLEVWSLEAEKYRVGVLHELLSLTLEKRASIHHVVEFRDELSLTKNTYQMLRKQSRTFYLAGTEMNWAVFLKDAYDENGDLIEKDPQLVFNEKVYELAWTKDTEGSAATG